MRELCFLGELEMFYFSPIGSRGTIYQLSASSGCNCDRFGMYIFFSL